MPLSVTFSAIGTVRPHTLALEQCGGGGLLGRALGAADPFGWLLVWERDGDAKSVALHLRYAAEIAKTTELRSRLARATLCGAGALLEDSALDPAALRQNVTSPGGTTAAALEILMGEQGLRPLLERAVIAATRRSRELAR